MERRLTKEKTRRGEARQMEDACARMMMRSQGCRCFASYQYGNLCLFILYVEVIVNIHSFARIYVKKEKSMCVE